MSEKSPSEATPVLASLGLAPPPPVEDKAAPVEEAKAAPEENKSPVADAKPEEKPKEAESKPVEAREEILAELKASKEQLKHLRDTWTQERQATKEAQRIVKELQASIKTLEKKWDGTYDEAKDAPQPPNPQDLVAEADRTAAIRTSHYAAVQHFMEAEGLSEQDADAKVKAMVWNDDAPFRKFDGDPAVTARVMNAKVPIMEAIRIVKEDEAKQKYGSNPEQMRKAIEKEVRETIAKEVRAQVLKELGREVQEEPVKGLGSVRSATGRMETAAPAALNLNSLFPNFAKTHG